MSVRGRAAHGGFTVVEVVMAMAILSVGLLATMAALQHGVSGVETGRGESIATFLVEDKLEELKALALLDWTNAALQAGTRTEYCYAGDFACSPTPRASAFRRTTTLADNAALCATTCKLATVSVFFRAVTGEGPVGRERRVDATTMPVARP